LARNFTEGYRLSKPGKNRGVSEVRPLVDEAIAAGGLRPDVSSASIFGLVSGIPAAAEMSDDPHANRYGMNRNRMELDDTRSPHLS
jgi:hypothetical protein